MMNGETTAYTDEQPTRPNVLPVLSDNIPDELKRLNQWVTWKLEFRDGRWTKPPYQVDGRYHAKANDSSTWGTFGAAYSTYEQGIVDGVGFEPTPEVGLVLIDLDHCIDVAAKRLQPWAEEITRKFNTYTERSPIDGVRILAKGALPFRGRKKGAIEVYSAAHYLTLTGQKFRNAPATIETQQAEIDWLYEKFFKEPEQAKHANNGNGNGAWHPSDNGLLEKAFAAKNGEKLRQLFQHGDFSGYGSQSEADLALCSKLAFWAADEAQLDRLFRRSALYRDKWDQRHGAMTYGEMTVSKAWASTTEHYKSAGDNGGEHPTPNCGNSEDEGVKPLTCSPEEPDEKPPEEIAFPECAWVGPFAIFRDITTHATESPQEYLWASCLVTIGLALGRNIRIENPRPLFPNFYALLMGPTGDDRKSTALYFAGEALLHLGMADQVDMLRGIQSAEAIYDSLARMDGAKSLAYCDEFRSLLSVAKRKGTQDIIPRLSSLYYCPSRDSLNRHEDSTQVVNPFLSLIAATPAEYVQDLLSNLEIDGGFLNRFLTITGKVTEWKAIAPRAVGWEPFARQVKEIQSHYDDHRFTWTEDSAALWTEFYVQWKTSRQKWNERDRKLTARIDEHILKLAMVYSAIEKQSALSCEALVTALSIGKWLQATTLKAFGDVGNDPFSRGEKVVLELVKAKGKMYRRYLQQWVHKKGINGEVLTRIVTSLVKNGQLREGVEVSSAGQKKPWVEYVS